MKLIKRTKIQHDEDTYNLHVKNDHNYIVNGAVVKNCHGAKSTSLISILTSMKNCKYRFGTTGTLDNNELNKATIEGLFGAPYKAISTREMIDQGYAADIKIKCIILKHKNYDGKPREYQEEVDYLVSSDSRNNFLKNLVLSLKGNKLLFFRLVDKHGKILYDLLKKTSQKIFYIDGDVSAEERNLIREYINKEEECTLIASLGTTSTGVSINRLHHMIAGSPSKSKIRVLQSIGRMLRQHKEKTHANLYDIVDDFGNQNNHTYRHFLERVKIYKQEQFEYKIYNVELK